MNYLLPTLIIFLLLLYVVYLHHIIYKKQSVIESFVKKIVHINRNKHNDDLVKLLKELNIDYLADAITGSKIANEDVMQFIFDDELTSELFIHYTREEEIANKILSEGFKYYHSLYKTSEKVHNDEIDLTFKHHQHKGYGKYVIVISIAKTVYDFYKNEIHNISRFVSVEHVLSERVPINDENDETIFTLSSSFIKGYFNYETGDIVRNSSFNANQDLPVFKENVERFRKEYLKPKSRKKR